MKTYFYHILVLCCAPILAYTQNVGIGGQATRARLEVWGTAVGGNTNAVFGSDGAGISFQQNWPTIGFNQYRNSLTGYGTYMHAGYGAIQYLDPGNGGMALEMQNTAGTKDAPIASEFKRAFTIFPNGSVCFGKGNIGTDFAVDYPTTNPFAAKGSIYFYGSTHPSFINTENVAGMPTQLGPGKNGGVTYINDLPGNNVAMGTRVCINTGPLYQTTLSIRHSDPGNGLLLIEQYSYNHWEWYVSYDDPCWIGQKYNGLLIGDYNPDTGVHGYVSDRRLKTGIRPLPPVLNKLLQLHPVEYHMKGEAADAPLSQGFIAQQVKELFPEVVSIINDNSPNGKGLEDLQMLNYSQFFVLAIKAIQEQQAEIAMLQTKLNRIEKLNQ
jgi:hypothetical protein